MGRVFWDRNLARFFFAFVLLLFVCGISMADAETEVPYRLPFTPAPTWEEAQEMDLEIVNIMDDTSYSWVHIIYRMPDDKTVTVFYNTDAEDFSWAEIAAREYIQLPEATWGFFRYDSFGRMENYYFCVDSNDSDTSLYSHFDTYMRMTRVEYYYPQKDSNDRDQYSYDCVTQEWDYPEGITIAPFDEEEILASVYRPEIMIVRNPDGLELPDSIEFTDPDRINYKPILPDQPSQYYLDTYLMPTTVTNEDLLCEAVNTPKEITWRQLSGPTTPVYMDSEGVIRLDGEQTSPCGLEYEVTATWGDYSTTSGFTVIFYEITFPTTPGFGTEYTLNVGDTLELLANFDDGSWPNRIWRSVYAVDSESVYDENSKRIIDWWQRDFKTDIDFGSILTIEAYSPGTARLLVEANQDGLAWKNWITINVLNGPAIDTLRLPYGLEEISEEAFTGIAAKKVVLPLGCKIIGRKAFSNMPYLTTVVIPNSVEEIADDILLGCEDVTIVTPKNSPAYSWAVKHSVPVEEQ